MDYYIENVEWKWEHSSVYQISQEEFNVDMVSNRKKIGFWWLINLPVNILISMLNEVSVIHFFSGCQVKSGSLVEISLYLVRSISWMMICLSVSMIVIVGDVDALVTIEEISFVLVVVNGISNGDEFVVFIGEERIWTFLVISKYYYQLLDVLVK